MTLKVCVFTAASYPDGGAFRTSGRHFVRLLLMEAMNARAHMARPLSTMRLRQYIGASHCGVTAGAPIYWRFAYKVLKGSTTGLFLGLPRAVGKPLLQLIPHVETQASWWLHLFDCPVRVCVIARKSNDTDFAPFGNVRYISVTRTSCFTMGAYGGSNSDRSSKLTLYVNVLLMIYSPSAISLLATDYL